MKRRRIVLCRFISPALLGNDMENDRLFFLFGRPDCPNELVHIVTVHRSHIFNPEIFKKSAGNEPVFQRILGLFDTSGHRLADARNPFQSRLHICLKFHIIFVGTNPVQIITHTADIFRNRHFVIV